MNENNKYRVLVDYGTENFAFLDGEYETVDEAVKAATKNSYTPFTIVKIINWKAINSDNEYTTQEEERQEKNNTRDMTSQFTIVMRDMTSEELKEIRKWAKAEIAEYEAFIKDVNEELKKRQRSKSWSKSSALYAASHGKKKANAKA